MSQPREIRPPLGLLALGATTFFIVSGGPYGLEEIIHGHGYGRALALLALVPLLWSVPVALLVGELGSALPEEGGYYAWVRRALGPFWGAQEAWLSLVTSLFDMAIYPTLFVAYLGGVFPGLASTEPLSRGWWAGVAMIGACAAWNLRGTRAVGVGSGWAGALLLSPFAVMAAAAAARVARGDGGAAWALLTAPAPEAGASAWVAGLLVCMWNYMGWDNASTVAAEVRDPQRNYPRAMLGTLLVVAGCYTLSVAAAAVSGLPSAFWETGSWVAVGRALGGPAVAALVVVGGAVSASGMFNALLLSMTRLPLALAHDRLLPAAVAYRHPKTGAPAVAIVALALAYAACLGLGIRRLVELDVALYGASLFLEFVALVVLRIREPSLPRPFRVPGGLVGAIVLGVPPLGLLAAALWSGRDEPGLLGLSALQVAGVLVLLGPVWYGATRALGARLTGRS